MSQSYAGRATCRACLTIIGALIDALTSWTGGEGVTLIIIEFVPDSTLKAAIIVGLRSSSIG